MIKMQDDSSFDGDGDVADDGVGDCDDGGDAEDDDGECYSARRLMAMAVVMVKATMLLMTRSFIKSCLCRVSVMSIRYIMLSGGGSNR